LATVGKSKSELGGIYLEKRWGKEEGQPPRGNIEKIAHKNRSFLHFSLKAIKSGGVVS